MAASLTFPSDSLTARKALALSLSVGLHLCFGLFIFALAREELVSQPIEISIFEGPLGPASPPPGEKSAEPGPIGPPPETVAPAPEAPKAAPAPRVKSKVSPAVKAPPPPRAIESEGLLGALRKSGPAPLVGTRAFEGVSSSVQLRQRPSDDVAETTGTLGVARARAEVAVGQEVVSSGGPAVSGSLGAGVGSVVLPGPGGNGSGWGGGGTGGGGGGTGRGGFSVSGAGSGGAGRSYGSIWNWTQRYLAGLRWAYNNELRKDPALRGVLVVRYEILSSGSVGDVKLISSALKDPRLEQEVLNQIRGWRYPAETSGDVVVTWPFSFLPPS